MQNATAARIAPSGFYCASGDATGTGECASLLGDVKSDGAQVRIWDTVGEEQTLKAEYKVLAGKMCVAVYDTVFARELTFVISLEEKIWSGMARANVLSRSGRDETSEDLCFLSVTSWFDAV